MWRGESGHRRSIPDFRQALGEVLTAEPNLEAVGAEDDVDAALDQIERHRPDTVIGEVDMPDGDGTRLIRACHQISPSTRFIAPAGGSRITVCDRVR